MPNNYTYKADVFHVVDGDTIDVRLHLPFNISLTQRIRLADIDAPESRTRDLDEKGYGIEAKTWLIEALDYFDNKCVITTQLDGKGKFGRVLGTIKLNDVNINALMIDLGLATPYYGRKKDPWIQRKAVLLDARKNHPEVYP